MLSWPPGSLGHTIAAQAVVLVFPALFVVDLVRWANGRTWLRRAALALTVIVLLTFVATNLFDYFGRWPHYPDVRHEYQAPITAVGRYLERHDMPSDVAVSAPYVDYWHPWSVRNYQLYAEPQPLLTKGRRADEGKRVRWFNGTDSILFPASQDPQEGALFILPDHIRLPSELDSDLRSLLLAGSRPIETPLKDANGSSLELYLWEDRHALELRLQSAAGAKVWGSPEGPYVAGQSEQQRQELNLPLDFGGRLSLLGYHYDADRIGRGTEWRLTTYWQVADTDSSPLAIFVHALDESNAVTLGWDGLHVSTEGWRSGDIVVQVHTLTVPADAPVGTQRVELGIYSPISLQRLPIFAERADEPTPHARVLLSPLHVH
jgi:hypothetical protein